MKEYEEDMDSYLAKPNQTTLLKYGEIGLLFLVRVPFLQILANVTWLGLAK